MRDAQSEFHWQGTGADREDSGWQGFLCHRNTPIGKNQHCRNHRLHQKLPLVHQGSILPQPKEWVRCSPMTLCLAGPSNEGSKSDRYCD
jgi:hypothetical protein